jgi:cGMP-dependent protein kinase
MKHFFLNSNETVFEQGKPGNYFYVVASGKLEVIINLKPVSVLKPGDSFGEMALIHDTLRTATIKTLEKSSLWGLDRKTFRKTLELLESVNYLENKQFIETIPIFETLTTGQKEALVHSFSTQYFNPGTKIIKEGDPGELLYIVKEGNVLCTRAEQEIRRMGKGSYFGEQALIYNEMRTATVTAIDNVKAIAISGAKLNKVLGDKLSSIIYQNSMRICMEKNQLLKKLNKEQIELLMVNMKLKNFSDGSVVIHAGTHRSSYIWLILKGTIAKEGREVIGKVFDILAVESMIKDIEGLFETNLVAQGETDVAFISKEDFRAVLGADYFTVIKKNEALKVLRKVMILRSLNSSTLNKLFAVMKEENFEDGQTIVEQNDLGDSFFIVKHGNVEAFRDGVSLRVITKHDYFGERSLLFNDFRSATVVARGKVSCWKLLRTDFMTLIQENVRVQLLKRIDNQDDSILLEELTVVKLLGAGMFGNVFLAAHKGKKKLFALKSVDRKKISAYELHESITLEKRILMQLDHVFIIKLIKTFKDDHRLYFLLEYINGMDLFEVMRKLNLLNESDSKFYTCCLIDILEHLHEREIIYRDLKPENIVIDEEGYPKLIDFGTAKFLKGRTYTIIGTPHYMAPEIITSNGYGLQSDCWSLGIMIFEFLFGMVPFGEDDEDPYIIYQKVQERKLDFPGWMSKASKVQDLISQLLSKNPAKRIPGGYENLKLHSWFTGFDWEKLASKALQPPYAPQGKDWGNFEHLVEGGKEIDEAIRKVEDQDKIPSNRRTPVKVKDGWDQDF